MKITRTRAATFAGIVVAMCSAAVPAQAGAILVTGAGAPFNCGGSVVCYVHDFGDVAIGESRSVSIDISFSLNAGETFIGDRLAFFPTATSDLTIAPGGGAPAGAIDNFGCNGDGCTQTVTYRPTALTDSFAFLTVDFSWRLPTGATGRDLANISLTGRGTEATSVPEPATFVLVALGLAGIARARRRKMR